MQPVTTLGSTEVRRMALAGTNDAGCAVRVVVTSCEIAGSTATGHVQVVGGLHGVTG
jgi:hypothetical protein